MTIAADVAYTLPVMPYGTVAIVIVFLIGWQEVFYRRWSRRTFQKLRSVNAELQVLQNTSASRSAMIYQEMERSESNYDRRVSKAKVPESHPVFISLSYSKQLTRTLTKIWNP
jgi:hypothetical protein